MKHHTSPSGERQQGFTLLELLIAVAIFAVVVSMTYGAYSMTFSVISKANTNAGYGERARVALERITDDLTSLYMGNSGIFQGESVSFGEFRGDSLRFTSTAHLLFHKEQQPRGYTVIAYTVEEVEGASGLRLYRSDEPVLPGVEAEDDRGFLLCDGLREVAFDYLDEDGSEQDSWGESSGNPGGKTVPAMVTVRLGFVSEENVDDTVFFSTSVPLR